MIGAAVMLTTDAAPAGARCRSRPRRWKADTPKCGPRWLTAAGSWSPCRGSSAIRSVGEVDGTAVGHRPDGRAPPGAPGGVQEQAKRGYRGCRHRTRGASRPDGSILILREPVMRAGLCSCSGLTGCMTHWQPQAGPPALVVNRSSATQFRVTRMDGSAGEGRAPPHRGRQPDRLSGADRTVAGHARADRDRRYRTFDPSQNGKPDLPASVAVGTLVTLTGPLPDSRHRPMSARRLAAVACSRCWCCRAAPRNGRCRTRRPPR